VGWLVCALALLRSHTHTHTVRSVRGCPCLSVCLASFGLLACRPGRFRLFALFAGRPSAWREAGRRAVGRCFRLCAFVSAFVHPFRVLLACVLSWVDIWEHVRIDLGDNLDSIWTSVSRDRAKGAARRLAPASPSLHAGGCTLSCLLRATNESGPANTVSGEALLEPRVPLLRRAGPLELNNERGEGKQDQVHERARAFPGLSFATTIAALYSHSAFFLLRILYGAVC
jgi:hypothetical protein